MTIALDQLAEAIETIIQRRRPLADRITRTEAALQRVGGAVAAIAAEVPVLADKVGGDGRERLQSVQLDASDFSSRIQKELAQLSKLRARFSRPTLNIGTVGRARQGKSRLLQSITGLTTTEIPDGDREHCTGVRSTIRHAPNAPTSARIFFYSEQTFIDEVIAPYFVALHLGEPPRRLADLRSKPLPPRKDGGAEAGAKYNHLKRYVDHLEQYQALIGAAPLEVTGPEIRKYVAQDSESGERVFFNYMAVREAVITCDFRNDMVTSVVVVDMPGLGDTGVGDEARLLHTLGEDVDLIVFVRMPKPAGDSWMDVDVQLYDTAAKALPELPLPLWSMMVLNKTKQGSKLGNNLQNCADFEKSIHEKNIDVVSVVTADSSEPRDARELVLKHAIEFLLEHLPSLDARYAQRVQARVDALRADAEAFLSRAAKALGPSMMDANERQLLFSLFSEFRDKKLPQTLEGLLRRLRERRGDADEDFVKATEEALQRADADSGLPDVAAIEKRRDKSGAWQIAYFELMHEVRTNLSEKFLTIDQGIKRSLEGVKTEVAGELADKAGLRPLSQKSGTEWLNDVRDALPASCSNLALGFDVLARFDLSYRGLVQHRIRTCLDDLTPDLTTQKMSETPSAAEISLLLQTLHKEAVFRCREALAGLSSEPSLAAFAIVEEFVDRVLRSPGHEAEWYALVEQFRADIWPEQFRQLGERSRLRERWDGLVAAARSALSEGQFSFSK